jgi:hypothetical protein
LVLELGEFSSVIFDGIIAIVSKNEFLALDKSWLVLKLFEENIEYLSTIQKDVLLEQLQSIFHSLNDPTSSFLAAEIIVDLYPDQKGFNALMNLSVGKTAKNRPLIPHGFQHLVKKCEDPIYVEKALCELGKMKSDSNQSVTEQAIYEYSTLKRPK